MPGWLKILLAIVGAFVLVLVALGFVGYRCVLRHKEE